jgi:RNA-directed DNA polymerase
MHKRQTSFDHLCDPHNLMTAFAQVRKNKGGPGIDQMTLAQYERELIPNLDDLAQRLREGRYYPMPLRTIEMKKASGGVRSIGILTIEDRILQRAALNALEPRFESSFLDCSYGFRPSRNVPMSVKRVLDYRAAGDVYVVDADIRACFDSLDHSILMNLIRQREPDKRMLGLIRLWLDTGQCLAKNDAPQGSLYDRTTTYLTNSLSGAVSDLLAERGVSGYGYHPYPGENLYEQPEPEDLHRRARQDALKRLGKDVAILGLTYAARVRNLVSPTTLAISGAMVVASAAYPLAERVWRERFGPRPIGAVQGGALSPLLANIYLHEFDQTLVQAGLHLVRYADDFVICCPDEKSAQRALELAGRKLAELRLTLHPGKTRVTRFDEGLEFLGYRFHQFDPQATPIAVKNTSPIVTALQAVKEKAPVTIAEAKNKIVPMVARLSQSTAHQIKDKTARLHALLKRTGGAE